jgi:hypothetical protein
VGDSLPTGARQYYENKAKSPNRKPGAPADNRRGSDKKNIKFNRYTGMKKY